MLRKIYVIIAASAAAVSLLATVPVRADDAPKSVSESAPNRASHHDAAPTQKGARAKQTDKRSTQGTARSPRTPSSVSESGPTRASQHDAAPTQKGARSKKMEGAAQGKTSSPQTSSSVSESGPNPPTHHEAAPTERAK